MDFFLNMTLLNLQMAAMYGVLALGVYITYSILDFPDLSVDGTVPLGGVVSAMLILKGVNLAGAVGRLRGGSGRRLRDGAAAC